MDVVVYKLLDMLETPKGKIATAKGQGPKCECSKKNLACHGQMCYPCKWAISREVCKMNRNSERMVINAYFGDGCIHNQGASPKYSLKFSSISLDYLQLKYELCAELMPCRLRVEYNKGFANSKPIHLFSTRSFIEIGELATRGTKDLVEMMDITDLVMFYLDDGSIHRAHGTVHIYCNSFNDRETYMLMSKIDALLGEDAPCRIRKDRKKDGREFNYIYIPRTAAEHLMFETEKFLNDNKIESLRYKVFYYADTLNDQRKTNGALDCGRPLKVGKYTLESSRVELASVNSKREGRADA